MSRLHPGITELAPRSLALAKALAIALGFTLAAASDPAFASHAAPEQGDIVPCAVLERFAGLVQVLDQGRDRVVDVKRGAPIPCGGSISIGQGWAQLKHRDGHRIYAAADSFLEVPESTSEQIILYRGQIYAQAEIGSTELRVLTANARARSKLGTFALLFSRNEEETQLVSLEHTASLENRFEPSRKSVAKAGEATSLNFKLLRVTPSDPRAVSVASLKTKLAQLKVPEKEYKLAVRTAVKRSERRIPAVLSGEEGSRSPASDEGSPKPAAPGSHGTKQVSHDSYDRHPAQAAQAEELERQWRSHLTGGDPSAEHIVFPKKKERKVKILTQEEPGEGRAPASEDDSAHGLNISGGSAEEKERRRLIEELSKIREE